MSKPKQIWFRARNYGWGWTPASWQGWLVFFLWIIVFAGIIAWLNIVFVNTWVAAFLSVLAGFVLTSILLAITYSKGEPPAWNWGKSNKQ